LFFGVVRSHKLGSKEEGRRKKEEGKGKREEGIKEDNKSNVLAIKSHHFFGLFLLFLYLPIFSFYDDKKNHAPLTGCPFVNPPGLDCSTPAGSVLPAHSIHGIQTGIAGSTESPHSQE
jgi:hypothetical protein